MSPLSSADRDDLTVSGMPIQENDSFRVKRDRSLSRLNRFGTSRGRPEEGRGDAGMAHQGRRSKDSAFDRRGGPGPAGQRARAGERPTSPEDVEGDTVRVGAGEERQGPGLGVGRCSDVTGFRRRRAKTITPCITPCCAPSLGFARADRSEHGVRLHRSSPESAINSRRLYALQYTMCRTTDMTDCLFPPRFGLQSWHDAFASQDRVCVKILRGRRESGKPCR